MLRNATSTCSSTSASVPGFLQIHVEWETIKCSIILVDPLLHIFLTVVFSLAFFQISLFSISLCERKIFNAMHCSITSRKTRKGTALQVWSGSPDSTWPDLKGEVMVSKPQIDSAMELFKFVLAFAGGKTGSYLIATDEFVRADGHPGRQTVQYMLGTRKLSFTWRFMDVGCFSFLLQRLRKVCIFQDLS